VANLLLHCGANRVSVAELENQPYPKITETHRPIPHSDFRGMVVDSLFEHGYSIRNEANAITPNGSRYFGLLELAYDFNDYSVVIGVRNSHDKSYATGLVIGSSVFVCDNLCFSGQLKVERRNTKNILEELPSLIDIMLMQMKTEIHYQDKRLTSYQYTDITNEHAEHAFIQLVRNNVIPMPVLSKSIQEWDNPRHAVFARKSNVWRLFNAVTEASKGQVFNLPQRGEVLHKICDELVALAA
jgi:hypothetical protein